MVLKIQSGMLVEARYKSARRFFNGKVTHVNADGTFAVHFDWGHGRGELVNRVSRRDVRLPGHRTKDEFDINQLLLSERADKVQHKLRKATKRAGSTGAMLSDVNSQLMASSSHQASLSAHLHRPLALEEKRDMGTEVKHHSQMGEWLKSLHEEPLEDRIQALEQKKGHRRSWLPKLLARSLNMEHATCAPLEPTSSNAQSNDGVSDSVVDAPATAAVDGAGNREEESINGMASLPSPSPKELPAVPHNSPASTAMVRRSSSAAAEPPSVNSVEDAGQRRAKIIAAARAAVANALLAQASPAFAKTCAHRSKLERSRLHAREATLTPTRAHSSARQRPLKSNGAFSGKLAHSPLGVLHETR